MPRQDLNKEGQRHEAQVLLFATLSLARVLDSSLQEMEEIKGKEKGKAHRRCDRMLCNISGPVVLFPGRFLPRERRRRTTARSFSRPTGLLVYVYVRACFGKANPSSASGLKACDFMHNTAVVCCTRYI